MLDASFENIEDAPDRDLQHRFRHAVEELSSVDESEMVNGVDSLDTALDDAGISNIPNHHFKLTAKICQPPLCSARIVVEDAHTVTFAEQAPRDCRPDKARTTGDKKMSFCQSLSFARAGRAIGSFAVCEPSHTRRKNPV